MRLHHFGFVGRDLAMMQRRFRSESSDELTDAIADQTQRVVVQFFRDKVSGHIWEIIAPLAEVEGSPIAGRIARGGGLDHVCYELEDSDGTLESVLAGDVAIGGRVTCPPVHAAAFGRRIAFVLHKSGRLIEYVETRRPGDAL